MFRTALSIVAVASLLAALPSTAAAAQSKASSRAAAKPSTNATVNLNTASAVDLEALPGIGAKTAARIVEYRQKNGPFKKIEEILETSRFCPYSLSDFDLGSRPSVSGSR
jgi:competence ComEA-like helix-hairpin-helix protein